MGMLDKIRGKDNAHDHAGHKHHDDAHVAAGTPGATHDPVCNMWVDSKKAQWKSDHAGTTVYFCSAGCKKKFDSDPHKYLGAHSH